MVYLIDKRIKYRTEDGSIWPLGDEESTVILTLTMNRLLACLLNRHGQVLTRNELLDDVWDAHGLRSSNHTLNKYISELRKCFSRLGISAECITTVPRVGFMFSRNIDVQIIDNDIPESLSQSETVLQQENTLQISKQAEESRSDLVEKKQTSYQRFRYTILSLIIVIMSIIMLTEKYWYPENRTADIKDTPRYFLFNYETCPVYTIQKNSISLTEKKKRLFLELVRRENISCLTGASFTYHASESYLYGKEGRVFISRCTSKDRNYISCLNYYWSGHESNI